MVLKNIRFSFRDFWEVSIKEAFAVDWLDAPHAAREHHNQQPRSGASSTPLPTCKTRRDRRLTCTSPGSGESPSDFVCFADATDL